MPVSAMQALRTKGKPKDPDTETAPAVEGSSKPEDDDDDSEIEQVDPEADPIQVAAQGIFNAQLEGNDVAADALLEGFTNENDATLAAEVTKRVGEMHQKQPAPAPDNEAETTAIEESLG